MRIRISVAGQDSPIDQRPRFNFDPPLIYEAIAGSLQQRRGFQNARGGEKVLFRGFNLGGVPTESTILIQGKECRNAEWQSGASDPDAMPYMSCTAPEDTVGPKSVFVCIANQTTHYPRFRSDVGVLQRGQEVGAWNEDAPADTGIAGEIRSLTNTRCKVGADGKAFSGRIHELCVECKPGADCSEPDNLYGVPGAENTFYKFDIATRDANGEVTQRAKERCPREYWDLELLQKFPSLVFRPTCPDYVKCEPPSSCAGDNQCATGYEYTLYTCRDKRATMEDNSCDVSMNPMTNEWEGDHSQCRGGISLMKECPYDKPELCSKCAVKYNETQQKYYGECECVAPVRCALCTANSHYRISNECEECPDNPALLIIGFFIAAIAACIGGYYLNKKQFNLAFISIGVDYFQVLALFAQSKILWPPGMIKIFNFLSIFNFNIDISAPECLVPNLSYELKWWATELLPVGAAVILFYIHISYTGYQFHKTKKKTKLNTHVNRLLQFTW